jgi:hypothetical protein
MERLIALGEAIAFIDSNEAGESTIIRRYK